jgi:aerobic-type carbon monoxide dehydrogenase small subunit (CoxS/CutS family)
MSAHQLVHLQVNGEPVALAVRPMATLLEALREGARLTGTKHGCDTGDCGACTVHVDGRPRLSCITLAADVEGRDVRTIEGVGTPARPDPVQACLDRHVGAQCGYCTPGIVMTLIALRDTSTHVSETDLREALGANLCRCTGYTKILDAAREALAVPRAER